MKVGREVHKSISVVGFLFFVSKVNLTSVFLNLCSPFRPGFQYMKLSWQEFGGTIE